MGSRPRKPTEWLRRIVDEQLKLILEPEVGAADLSADTYRRVQILIPASPPIFVSIDSPVPGDVALSRDYKIPPATPNTKLDFVLQPHQIVYAGATEGYAVLGLIVEYLED